MKWLILPTSVRFTPHRVNLKIQKGDVYAFAIIAQEICLRGPPFCNTHYRKLDNVFYYLTNTNLNTCLYPLLSPGQILKRIRRPPPLLSLGLLFFIASFFVQTCNLICVLLSCVFN